MRSSASRTGSTSDSPRGGELHIPAYPDQQLVIEVVAQFLQRGAHGGLGDEYPFGGPGDVFLVEQGVQGDEQVQVEAVQLHGKVGFERAEVVFGVVRGVFHPNIRPVARRSAFYSTQLHVWGIRSSAIVSKIEHHGPSGSLVRRSPVLSGTGRILRANSSNWDD